jgi:hypothetical protein
MGNTYFMEPDKVGHERLWRLSGERCAICHKTVVRPGEFMGQGQEVGIEWIIAGQPSPGDGYNNSVLLCQFDAVTVETHPEYFPDQELRRLKGEVERLFTQRSTASSSAKDESPVRLLAHTAYFVNSQVPMYFLKIVNDSLTSPVRIDSAWFDTDPATYLDNTQRPLPAILDPGDTFETWIPALELPPLPNMLHRARVRLGDGSVIESVPNTAVAPMGSVGSGGTPLSEIYVERRNISSQDPTKWDVFISYASEEKDEVARPLYDELTRRGLRVWYDDATLRIGESLRRKIDRGVDESAFAVVIISPFYIKKQWTQYEFDGIIAKTVAGKQRLLPIWHRITKDEVLRYSPPLADKVARNTSDRTIAEIADEIAERIASELIQD